MLFGDAKESITGIGDELKLLGGPTAAAAPAPGSPQPAV
jgi:hypothetical protein